MEEEITALLAPVAGGASYWVRAPQDRAVPFLTLQKITRVPDYHNRGESGLVQSRLQIDCYALTYGEAKDIATAARTILSGYRGGSIQGAFIDAERDLPASSAGEVEQLFRVNLDIILHHTET